MIGDPDILFHILMFFSSTATVTVLFVLYNLVIS